MTARFEYVTRRYVDERARAHIAEVEHRLELLAAALGIDLNRLVLVDCVERRDGVGIDWDEFVAIEDEPPAERTLT